MRKYYLSIITVLMIVFLPISVMASFQCSMDQIDCTNGVGGEISFTADFTITEASEGLIKRSHFDNDVKVNMCNFFHR